MFRFLAFLAIIGSIFATDILVQNYLSDTGKVISCTQMSTAAQLGITGTPTVANILKSTGLSFSDFVNLNCWNQDKNSRFCSITMNQNLDGKPFCVAGVWGDLSDS